MSNVSVADWKEFLRYCGLNLLRINGDHDIWSKDGLLRPVVFQSRITPVPEFVILNNLRTMKVTRKVLEEFLQNK